MAKKKFFDIKEKHIAIRFTNQEQLEKLVDYLKFYGYNYGTNKDNNLDEIKELSVSYFGKDNCYLSLDRSKRCYPRNFCSCGKGWQDVCYDFSRLDWNID